MSLHTKKRKKCIFGQNTPRAGRYDSGKTAARVKPFGGSVLLVLISSVREGRARSTSLMPLNGASPRRGWPSVLAADGWGGCSAVCSGHHLVAMHSQALKQTEQNVSNSTCLARFLANRPRGGGIFRATASFFSPREGPIPHKTSQLVDFRDFADL